MIRVSLRFFASRVLKTKRMDKGDRRTLERVIFSDGVRSRVEAEILLQLARTIRENDSAWTDFVVAAVVDFAVWGSRPTGYVDPDMADWLIAVLSGGRRHGADAADRSGNRQGGARGRPALHRLHPPLVAAPPALVGLERRPRAAGLGSGVTALSLP